MDNRIYADTPDPGFDAMPELAGYTEEPTGMYVGCPGKRGYLNLVFELDADGKSIMRRHDRRAPLIVQRELYVDEELPGMPCVYIISSGGPNVDGDRYVQEIRLKRDSMAFLTTAAATKLAEMKSNYSGMKQLIILEAGSYFEYLPLPLIPCKHTRYISDTEIVVDPTAAMFYSEIFTPGRTHYKEGERFEYDVLSICSHARRPSGEELYREKFIIKPADGLVRDIGVMGGFEVFGNVIVLAPKERADEIFEKTEPVFGRELAAGISRLPNEAGLVYKVLGKKSEPVKKIIREFCSTVRRVIKGVGLPREFAWR